MGASLSRLNLYLLWEDFRALSSLSSTPSHQHRHHHLQQSNVIILSAPKPEIYFTERHIPILWVIDVLIMTALARFNSLIANGCTLWLEVTHSWFESLKSTVCFLWEKIDAKAASTDNRPFYSCGLSTLAFQWMWGSGWPCFDTKLLFFLMEIVLENTS